MRLQTLYRNMFYTKLLNASVSFIRTWVTFGAPLPLYCTPKFLFIWVFIFICSVYFSIFAFKVSSRKIYPSAILLLNFILCITLQCTVNRIYLSCFSKRERKRTKVPIPSPFWTYHCYIHNIIYEYIYITTVINKCVIEYENYPILLKFLS